MQAGTGCYFKVACVVCPSDMNQSWFCFLLVCLVVVVVVVGFFCFVFFCLFFVVPSLSSFLSLKNSVFPHVTWPVRSQDK